MGGSIIGTRNEPGGIGCRRYAPRSGAPGQHGNVAPWAHRRDPASSWWSVAMCCGSPCSPLPSIVLWWHVWTGHPSSHPDVPLRRSGARGVVHGVAGVGHRARGQPVLLRRRERPPRSESPVQHRGHPGGPRAQPGDLAVGTGGGHQRGVDAGAGSLGLGLLARAAVVRGLEAGGDPGRVGLRVLGGHRHLVACSGMCRSRCCPCHRCSWPRCTRSWCARPGRRGATGCSSPG